MDDKVKRGKLIAFEGLDRSGKSLQSARLVEHLQSAGVKVQAMRFPDRTTPIGQMLHSYLVGQAQAEDHAIHLLFSANRWEAAPAIERLIAAGTTVVVDRYYYSGCVYSAAKNKPSLGLDWCRHPDVGLPRPDLCLFLDVSAEAAAARASFGVERYETIDLQERVRNLFLELMTHSDEREDFARVDAGGSVEQVGESIREAVAEAMARVDAGALPLRHVHSW